MSQELNRLIDKAIKSDQRIFEEIETNGFTTDEYIEAVTEKTRDKVYKEVKDEVREEALAEAEAIAEKRKFEKQISEIKKLTLQGIALAFFIGLLVNQITDVITFCKKSGMFSTGVTILVLVIISLLIIFLVVLQELQKIWKGNSE